MARELVADGYRVVDTDSVGLVACVGLGPDGRVRGGDYSVNAPSTVDIGLALRPDLTGQGRGRALVAQVAGFALSQHPGLDQRVTIAAFNSRAIRVWTQAGFVEESCFVRDGDRLAFAILRWVPED